MALIVYSLFSHRIFMHENIGKPHRKHVYQLMANELHIKHVVVSTVYMVMQLIISLGAIYLPMNKYLYLVVVLVLLCIVYVLSRENIITYTKNIYVQKLMINNYGNK